MRLSPRPPVLIGPCAPGGRRSRQSSARPPLLPRTHRAASGQTAPNGSERSGPASRPPEQRRPSAFAGDASRHSRGRGGDGAPPVLALASFGCGAAASLLPRASVRCASLRVQRGIRVARPRVLPARAAPRLNARTNRSQRRGVPRRGRPRPRGARVASLPSVAGETPAGPAGGAANAPASWSCAHRLRRVPVCGSLRSRLFFFPAPPAPAASRAPAHRPRACPPRQSLRRSAPPRRVPSLVPRSAGFMRSGALSVAPSGRVFCPRAPSSVICGAAGAALRLALCFCAGRPRVPPPVGVACVFRARAWCGQRPRGNPRGQRQRVSRSWGGAGSASEAPGLERNTGKTIPIAY